MFSVTKGSARVLAFLSFLLFSPYILQCAGAPASNDLALLSVREQPQAIQDFNAALDNADTKVLTGETGSIVFTNDGQSIGSGGFAGCIGAVIVSPNAAVIGHYTVTTTGMETGEVDLPAEYEKVAVDGQMADAHVYIYTQVKYNRNGPSDTLEYPEFVDQVKTMLEGIGFDDPVVQTYIEPSYAFVDEDTLEELGDERDSTAGAVLITKAGDAVNVEFITIELQTAALPDS